MNFESFFNIEQWKYLAKEIQLTVDRKLLKGFVAHMEPVWLSQACSLAQLWYRVQPDTFSLISLILTMVCSKIQEQTSQLFKFSLNSLNYHSFITQVPVKVSQSPRDSRIYSVSTPTKAIHCLPCLYYYIFKMESFKSLVWQLPI